MVSGDINLDFAREARVGLDEAIFCEGKTTQQIVEILGQLHARRQKTLLTRLSEEKYQDIKKNQSFELDFDPHSETAFHLGPNDPISQGEITIVSAGTSDSKVASEVSRTLEYYGHLPNRIADVGVAGLWRLLDRVEEISESRVVIAVAGMDAALPTVLGGLVRAPIIGVPTSVGYGVSNKGETALNAMLASCSPGLTVTNIDNGYGAACAALRILGAVTR